jgi:tetratricopeptide (TPR) repeat protein
MSAGNIHMASGRYEEAIAEFQKAVDANPDIAVGYDALGHASAMSGDPDRAISMLEKAIDLDEEYALAHAHLGRVYYTRLNWEEAVLSFDRAFELGLENEEFFYIAGLAHSYLDDCETGVKWLEKALEINPESRPAQDGIRRCQGK